jgi:FtsZ-binding cell division protein ZapB
MKVIGINNTMEIFFQTLANEFQDNSDLLEDLEEEVKFLPHSNTSLDMEVNQLTETNSQLTPEVSHLHAFVDEIHEEFSLLEEDKNKLFGEY